MTTAANLELRELRDDDLPSLLACQRACFGERAKSPEAWAWARGPAGAPRRVVVGLRGGRVVAAYAGTPARTWFAGEERWCVQAVDLMVHPDERAGLAGGRVHRAVAEAFFERYGTRGEDLAHYGWPIAAARRFGERLLEYAFVREELVLVREAGDGPRALPEGVEELSDFGADLRWLWDRCAPAWTAATVRDASWARWRFRERPGVRYRALGVRAGGHLRGLAVLRTTPWDWPGALPLVDWLVPPDEPEVAARLAQGVLAAGRAAGAQRVVTLLPPPSAAFEDLQERGWRVHPSPYALLVRSYDRRLDADLVRAGAWLTLADSDLA